MRTFFHVAVARIRAFFRPADLDHDFNQELESHLAMAEENKIRNGMNPDEARRTARVELGGLAPLREKGRRARGLPWLDAFLLDARLGLRLLRKTWALTLIGGLAITLASGIGISFAEFSKNVINPVLPLEEADRLVSVRNWDLTTARPEPRILHDFITWRDELTTLTDLSALAGIGRQAFTTAEGGSATLSVATVTASTFPLLRTPSLLGRTLVDADEQIGAPDVVVIGYEAWQSLFGGAPDVIGQTVQVASVPTTLVGVMPEGVMFPINQAAWVPLRINPLEYARLRGPGLQVFGRLAPRIDLAEAEAELSAIGLRTRRDFPETHEQLQAQVVPFVDLMGQQEMALVIYGARFLFVLLMAVVCANVATLVFARTVMRGDEIAVRTALGASRKRIVSQLFTEALVLVAGATVLALAISQRGLNWGMDLFWQVQQGQAPYWWNNDISMPTILYAATLALVGAVMVGVVPGLKATGRDLQSQLRQIGSGPGGSLRFGGMWTAMVVIQVALSVDFLPFALTQSWNALESRAFRTDFPAQEYLSARLIRERDELRGTLTEPEEEAFKARTIQLFADVKERISEDPGVGSVTLASWLSAMNHPVDAIEIESDPADPILQTVGAVRILGVDEDYFETMNAPVVSGRSFFGPECGSEDAPVIVNQSFLTNVTGGQNPIGHRVRFARQRDDLSSGSWHEIVGVIPDPEMDVFGPNAHSVIYRPLVPGTAESLQLFVRVRSPADAVAPRLHAMLSTLDESLVVEDLLTIEEVWRPVHTANRFFGWMLALVAFVAMLLSIAGIYALMSFAVSQRTREIGIRVAVGASPARIAATVFKRTFAQIGVGVAIGIPIGLRIMWPQLKQDGPGSLFIVTAMVLVAGLVAGAVPVRRALGVQPTDALRSGG